MIVINSEEERRSLFSRDEFYVRGEPVFLESPYGDMNCLVGIVRSNVLPLEFEPVVRSREYQKEWEDGVAIARKEDDLFFADIRAKIEKERAVVQAHLLAIGCKA